MSNHSQAKKAALGNPQVVEKDRLGWPVDRRGYTSKMSDNALITSYFLLLNLRASLLEGGHFYRWSQHGQ
jgi:hypothetical protein